jgi:hypothetical protein
LELRVLLLLLLLLPKRWLWQQQMRGCRCTAGSSVDRTHTAAWQQALLGLLVLGELL